MTHSFLLVTLYACAACVLGVASAFRPLPSMKSLLRTQGSPGPGHWRFCIGRGVARIAIVAMCFETFAVSGFGSAILASSVALLSHFAFVTYHNRVTRAFAKHGYQWSRKSFLVNGQQETRNVLTWSLK